MKVKDKVVVVTGAGGGIGGALVASLLKRGARVVAVDLSQENLDKLKESAGDKVSVYALNIANRDEVARLSEWVTETHGQVDGLINCAGIVQPFVKVNDLDIEVVERVMNVNFYGTLFMVKAFLPKLLERPEAHIMNVSSMGGFLPVPGQAVYGASKAAVKLMTEGLYAELLDTNVHVTVVFPGATKTEITKNSGVGMPSGADAASIKIPMLLPEQAAEIMIKGMEKNKMQIFTGKDSNLMNRLYRLKPKFATKLLAKQMRSLLK